MPTTCTRCEGTGFLNMHQIPDETLYTFDWDGSHAEVLKWIEENDDHDVQVCDCCGDGDDWYGVPGEHYNSEDPAGFDGPYLYNGGFCECH